MSHTDDHHDDMAEEFYDICKLCHDKPCVCPPRESKDDVIAFLLQQVADLTEAVRVLGEECADMREREPIGRSTNPGIIFCRKAVNANPLAAAAVRENASVVVTRNATPDEIESQRRGMLNYRPGERQAIVEKGGAT